jgi:hypothetical protein
VAIFEVDPAFAHINEFRIPKSRNAGIAYFTLNFMEPAINRGSSGEFFLEFNEYVYENALKEFFGAGYVAAEPTPSDNDNECSHCPLKGAEDIRRQADFKRQMKCQP